MVRTVDSQGGMSILAAVIALLSLGVMGVTTATLMGTHQASRSLTSQRQEAAYLAQAGLEYGLMQIDQGGIPNTTKSLGRGTFTVQVLPAQHLVRSTGVVGEATQEYRITDNFLGGNCVSVNNALATLTGPHKDRLRGITFVKTCLSKVTIDRWIMTWAPTNPAEKVLRIEIPQNNYVWADPAGVTSGALIDAVDYTLDAHITQLHEILFGQDMSCKLFSMQLVFTDGSSATMPHTLLGAGLCP